MIEWNRDDVWEVQRTYHELSTIKVKISATRKTQDIPALRRIVPELGSLPLGQFPTGIAEDGTIHLGEMAGRVTRRIEADLTEAGVSAERRDTSTVSFLPINRTRGMAWIIEDEADCQRIARQMIAEGVPVTEVEA